MHSTTAHPTLTSYRNLVSRPLAATVVLYAFKLLTSAIGVEL
jgi:hypothetical protein